MLMLNRKKAGFAWTPERRAKAKRMRLNQATYADIARAVGCSSDTVRHLIVGMIARCEVPRYLTGSAWTEERVATLRELWAAGISTTKIGRAIGLSKNAIIGKAHRLGLKARENPIKRPVKAVPVPCSPEVEDLTEATARLKEAVSDEGEIIQPWVRPLQREPRLCLWPGVELGGDPADYPGCDQERIVEQVGEEKVRRPYCAEHVKRAYNKWAKRSESEAGVKLAQWS